MRILHSRILLVFLWMALGFTPSMADLHHPTTLPLLRVDNVDIYWKRADQKYIHFTIHIFNAATENLNHPFEVRMAVRSNDKEEFRPIKVWQQTGINGHEMLELKYTPGAIADTAIYTGHFQLKIDVAYGDNKILDSQVQSYP